MLLHFLLLLHFYFLFLCGWTFCFFPPLNFIQIQVLALSTSWRRRGGCQSLAAFTLKQLWTWPQDAAPHFIQSNLEGRNTARTTCRSLLWEDRVAEEGYPEPRPGAILTDSDDANESFRLSSVVPQPWISQATDCSHLPRNLGRVRALLDRHLTKNLEVFVGKFGMAFFFLKKKMFNDE